VSDTEKIIKPYDSLPAMCLHYDPRAPDVAERVGLLIRTHLPEVTVEHIGSTAVPGLCGKGVIDLMIAYSEGRLEDVKAVLNVLGFQRQSTRDPFPESRPMRVGSLQHDGRTFQLHVHVIAGTSPETKMLRDFRDRLRADPALRADYVRRKRQIIAEGIVDSVEYCERKGEFITTHSNGGYKVGI
jgi:GrpB-like predicted nucleotidyltransferase (UPF0157 family)